MEGFRVLPFGGGYEFIDQFGNREFITDDNAFIMPRNLSFREKAKDFVQNRYGMSKDTAEILFGGKVVGNWGDALDRFAGREGLLGMLPISAGVLSGGQAVLDFQEGNISSGIGNTAFAGLDLGLSGLALRNAIKNAKNSGVLNPIIYSQSNVPNVARRAPPAVSEDTTSKIMAFHGSPYDFDKFDMSKMGTGEGAQAYGRGLYFSENEEVAKNYRDALSGGLISKVDGTPLVDLFDRLVRQADSINPMRTGVMDDQARAKANELYEKAAFLEDLEIKGSFDDALAVVENPKIAEWAKSQILPKFKPAGNIYQVEIGSDISKFLDYDAPLSEQSDFVKNALRRSNLPRLRKTSDGKFEAFTDPQGGYPKIFTGNTREEAMSNAMEGLVGADVARALPNPQYFQNTMNMQGVQGIRYLDQGSRGKGYEVNVTNKGKPVPMGILDEGDNLIAKTRKDADEIAKKYRKRGLQADVQPSGTRNFVVFDDKIIDIVKKYGIAGAATLLGMSQLDVQAAMAQENSRSNRGLLER